MSSPRRIILGTVLAVGVAAVAIPGVPGQNPNNPKGLDVSVYQGTINWTSVKNAGISFVIIRAGHGPVSGTDTSFAANWAGAKAVGLVRGAYWYAVPTATPSLSADAVAIANKFVNTVQPKKDDLQLCLDLENTGGLSAANLWTWVQAFCGQIQTLTHRPPIIYTGYYFWRDSVGAPTNNLGCPLWMARWSTTPLPLPSAWTDWAFWQYSDTGNVGGLNPVDQDTFNGNMSSLLTYTYPRDPLNRR